MSETKPDYDSEGTLEIPLRDFQNWLISYLPKGPYYAVSSAVFPNEYIMKVNFRSSTVGQPNPPLPPV